MAKLQEEMALCSAQLTAQAEETRATKESVMEARMEIEVRPPLQLDVSVTGIIRLSFPLSLSIDKY